MQVQIQISDTIWDEYLKLGEEVENIQQITETALINHMKKLNSYKDLLRLEGKADWSGDLNKLRENRI